MVRAGGEVVGFAVGLIIVTAALGALGGDTPAPSLLGGAGLALLGARAAWRSGVPPVFWSGALLTAALTLSSAARGQLSLAGPELAALLGAGGGFALGAAAGRRTDATYGALRLFAWWLFAVLAVSFVAHAADPDAVLGRAKPYHHGRLTGPFLSANTMATFCAVALCVGVGLTARVAGGAGGVLRALEALGRRGIAPGLVVLFALACLLLTGSRAGLAVGLLGAAWIGVWQVRARRGGGVRLWPVLLLAAPILVLAAASGGVLGDRLAGVGSGSDGRLDLWRASLAAWREAPLLGHGLGSFPRALAAQVTTETAPLLSVQNAAHNLALQWLVQTGLLGTIGGGAVLLHLGWSIRVGFARRRRARTILRIGTVALALALLHGLVDYAVEVPAFLWTLSLLAGLAAGAAGGSSGVRDRRAGPRARDGAGARAAAEAEAGAGAGAGAVA